MSIEKKYIHKYLDKGRLKSDDQKVLNKTYALGYFIVLKLIRQHLWACAIRKVLALQN